jgi:hypothetical protein
MAFALVLPAAVDLTKSFYEFMEEQQVFSRQRRDNGDANWRPNRCMWRILIADASTHQHGLLQWYLGKHL